MTHQESFPPAQDRPWLKVYGSSAVAGRPGDPGAQPRRLCRRTTRKAARAGRARVHGQGPRQSVPRPGIARESCHRCAPAVDVWHQGASFAHQVFKETLSVRAETNAGPLTQEAREIGCSVEIEGDAQPSDRRYAAGSSARVSWRRSRQPRGWPLRGRRTQLHPRADVLGPARLKAAAVPTPRRGQPRLESAAPRVTWPPLRPRHPGYPREQRSASSSRPSADTPVRVRA